MIEKLFHWNYYAVMERFHSLKSFLRNILTRTLPFFLERTIICKAQWRDIFYYAEGVETKRHDNNISGAFDGGDSRAGSELYRVPSTFHW